MSSLLINENQPIWLALIASLLMHGLIFAFSGRTFIQHARFAVQASAQTVEVKFVSLRETSDEAIFKRTTNSVKIATQPTVARNDKNIVRSKSGVRVKANPDYFQNPSPEYPELARQMRQEGIVMLAVDVEVTGEAVKVEIIQSSGYHLLDQAALKAVRHWKFKPGSIGSFPVASTVIIPIRFRLEK